VASYYARSQDCFDKIDHYRGSFVTLKEKKMLKDQMMLLNLGKVSQSEYENEIFDLDKYHENYRRFQQMILSRPYLSNDEKLLQSVVCAVRRKLSVYPID